MSLNCLEWGKPTFKDKFKQKGRTYEIVKTLINHYSSFSGCNKTLSQPFHFFFDSRFSSLKLMKLINEKNYFFLSSCSSIMKPKAMMDELKIGTPLRHWKIVNNSIIGFRLMAHHIKKGKFFFVASNYSSFKPHWTKHRRYKYPKDEYWTKEPQVIDEYNRYMGFVDIFDKMVQKYWRRTNYICKEHAYVTFFIHTCIHQAFVALNHHFKLNYHDHNQLQFRLNLLKRIKEVFIHQVPKKKNKHEPIKEIFSRNERKNCNYKGCKNKTAYYCPSCNNTFYCLQHMSYIHCTMLNDLLEK